MTDPHALADRRWFRLPARAWAAFAAHLNRPPVYKPRLAELMSREPVWADTQPRYPFKRNGKTEWTGCKQCAIALDDSAHYGDHR